MDFQITLRKAMIDKGIAGAKALSVKSGVSHYITLRILRGDTSCRLKDLVALAKVLDVDVKFINNN